jgi:hypothetical protein
MPYILDGRTYKVQFANIAAVGAVPSSRVIAAGTGLAGGGDLSANRVISIANGGVGFDQLALSGVTQGTYGSGSAVPILTVDSKGRITSATTAPLDVTGFVPTSRTITAGDGLTGGGSLANNISLAANFSATTPSALGTASAGTAITVSRGDHVHPAVDLSDTTQTQGALPLGRGGTGDALSPVAGAVVYSTGTKFALSNPGLPGQVLSSNGTDEPQWTSVGAGTVISVGVATANGFAGTVTNPSLSPVITLSTTVTGMLKGDGTAVSAATAGVDYVAPGAYVTSGLTMASARLLGRTTASVGAAEELTVGTGLTLSGGSLVNAAPDQVVALTGGTAISVTGTYPSFTVTNTAPDQTVSLTAGTAISISGTYPSFSVTNTAPDQVVSLTGAGTTTVTGTYPSFTITSNDSTVGTVTSVNASGGTTGMSFTGGPVTSAGTLTLNGTLAVANGGTGATDAATALTNLGAYPASNPSGFTSNVGTVTSVSGTGTVSGLSLSGTVTSAGSLTLGGTLAVLPSDFASQTANTVLAAPNGSAGTPTFRAIVAADIPTLNQNTTGVAANVTGIVAVANGGTGASVAATARTNLSAAASGANTDITSIALTTGTISTSPVNGTDIVNKAYADSIASGINFHQSVRLATAAALPANTYNNGTGGVGATLTANANGALSVDGVAVAVGNRILVKDEAAGANNGVYVVTDTGSSGGPGPGPGGSNPYILTRATDFDSAGTGVDQIDAGDFFLVTAGLTLSNTSWVQQTPLPITVGTTAIVFSQFAAPVLYSAGTGLTLTGTVFSITNTGVAASTYGSASSVPVIAVNAQGQLTSASSSAIAIAASQITSGALAIANGGTGATSAATALTNLGAYPASNPSGFTSNTGTVTSVNLTAGTGVSVSGGPITTSGSITVTNTAPDQVVSLTGSGATTVTGTYPNFTISSPASGAGTVTSINVSGGTTGLTTSGGPVTTSGTITLAGTLNVANGGTGATTLSSGYVLKGNGTSAVSASVIYDDGTNVGIGTTLPVERLRVEGNIIVPISKSFYSYTADYGIGTPDSNGLQIFTNTADVIRFGQRAAGAFTERMRIDTNGNLGLNTTTPAGRLSVVSGSSTGVATSAWSGNYSVFGPNAGSTTGAAVALGYNAAIDAAEILALAPSVAWKPLNLYSAGLNLYASSGGIGASLNGSGTFSAVTDIRAPIFYDSNNTGYYIDPASISVTSQINVGTGLNVFDGAAVAPDPYGIVGITRRTDANYSYLGFTRAGQHAMGMGIDTGNTFWIGGCSSGFNGVRTSSWLLMHTSGYVTAPVDMRAPIFYDSNDTNYYVDPNSLSVLTTVYATKAAANNTPAIQVRGGSPGFPRIQTYGLDADANAWMGLGTDMGGGPYEHSVYFPNGSGSGRLSIGDYNGTTYNPRLWVYPTYTQINNSARSPIFYDSDNTGFYLDPASGSNLNGTLVNSGGTAMTAGWNRNMMLAATFPVLVFNSANTKYAGIGVDYTTASAAMRFWVNASSSDVVTGTNAMNINTGGYVEAGGSFRSPIFYDLDNTAYYVDPSSTSNLVGLTVANTITGNAATATNLSTVRTNWSTNGTITAVVGQLAWKNYGNNHTIFDASQSTSPDGGAVNNTNADVAWSGTYPTLMGWNGALTYGVRVDSARVADSAGAVDFNSLTNKTGGTGTYTTSGDFRAPIFYDADNTAYYVDPAGTSNLYRTNGDGFAASQFLCGTTNYGDQVSASTWYGIGRSNVAGWTPGGMVQVAGYTGLRLRGAYSIIDLDGAVGGDLINFTTTTARFTGDVRATIFYDVSNTAYYLDPAGTSNLVGLTVANTITGNISGSATGLNSSNYIVSSGSSGNLNTDFQNTTANTFRYQGDQASLTNSPGGTWWIYQNMRHSNASNYWGTQVAWGWEDNANRLAQRNVSSGSFSAWFEYLNTSGRTYSGGLEMTGIIQSVADLRAPVFYDRNDTAYYGDFAGTSTLFNLNIIGTGNKYLQIQSTDGGEAMVRYVGATGPGWYVGKRTSTSLVDTASFHFYSENAGATVAGIDVSGNMLASGSFRAPIYYDSNNTAYYWNFADAAGSFISTIITGFAYFQSNRDTSSNSAPLQAYSTGSTGATMAFHRAGVFAVNMGLDSDNIFRIGGWSASNNLIQLDMSGNFTALTSSRAPIFYDSDNTAYYVDPNATSNLVGLTVANTITGSVSGSAGNVTGTVAVANGGTGATTLTANNVLLGNGTSAVQAIAPGTTGNVLTSNGTTWVSSAPTSVMELISTSSPSAASEVVFTGLSSTYSYYEIVFETSTGTISRCQLSTDNGATFQNSFYYSNDTVFGASTVTQVGASGSGSTYIDLGGPAYSGVIRFLYPTSTNDGGSNIQSQTQGLTTSSYRASGRRLSGGHNAIRLFPSSGTVTGTFKLYGVKA